MGTLSLQVIFMVGAVITAVIRPAQLQDSQNYTLPENGSFSDFISTESWVHHMEADKFLVGNILFMDGDSLKSTNGHTTETIIGRATEPGYVEGIGTEVRMNSRGFHQISADQVVIADYWNDCLRLLQRVTQQTSPYAGNCNHRGYADGIHALFYYPAHIITDTFHNDSTEEKILIITDRSNDALREMNTQTREVTTLIQSREKLYKPWGITQDSVTGDFFVTIEHGVVRFIYENKTLIHMTGSYGDRDGSFSDALFDWPLDIVLLANNEMLVVDYGNEVLRLLDLTTETTSSLCTGNRRKTNGRFDVCELYDPQSLLVVGDTLYCGERYGIRMVRDPLVPANLQSTAITSRSISLAWDKPGDAEGILSYEIYINNSRTKLQTVQSVVPPTETYILQDLYPNTIYNIRITGRRSHKEGPHTNAIQVKTKEAEPSGPPQNIRAKAPTPDAATTLRVEWEPPSLALANGAIAGYKLFYLPESQLEEREKREIVRITNATVRSIDIANLEVWTKYKVWMKAYTSVGDGPASLKFVCRTGQSVPEQPRDFTAMALNSSAVLLTWQQPSEREAKGVIRGYQIFRSELNEDNDKVSDPIVIYHDEGNATKFTSTGLLPRSRYSFQIRAHTIAGYGAASSVKHVETLRAETGPSLVGGVAGGVSLLIVVGAVNVVVQCWRRSRNRREYDEEEFEMLTIPDQQESNTRKLINNLKLAYLQNGAENFKFHQPGLEKLADLYCLKHSHRQQSEPKVAFWIDLFKAFTLYNSAAVGPDSIFSCKMKEKAWKVVQQFLGDNNTTSLLSFYSEVGKLQNELQDIRNHLKEEVDKLDKLLGDNPFELQDQMKDVVAKANTQMLDFVKDVFVATLRCIQDEPPCEFSVVGIGSFGRGEATPFSDLEYLFLIADEGVKPYFEKLAVMSYFVIGALRETNLKVADIEELKGWFVDRRRCGFQIDGITESSGNVPTGHGDGTRRNEFIVTPEELKERYRKVLTNPDNEALRGDLTAMLSFTTLLYTNQENENLLRNFSIEKKSLIENEKGQSRIKMDEEMLKHDLTKFEFSPKFDIYSSGFVLDVKRLIYRFPSIILLDIAIVMNACSGDSWETIHRWRQSSEGSSSSNTQSFSDQLLEVLTVACYTRLQCYLFMNSNSNPFRIEIDGGRKDNVQEEGRTYTFEENLKIWEIARNQFFELTRSLVNLQQHLDAGRDTPLSCDQLKVIVASAVDDSVHASFLAHYSCCEWNFALQQISHREEMKLAGNLPSSQMIAVAFAYQQCRRYNEALLCYNRVYESSRTLNQESNKQLLVTVYRGQVRCYLETGEPLKAYKALSAALDACGVVDMTCESELNAKSGIACIDFGMLLLEAGRIYYNYMMNYRFALHLLFKSMKYLILDASHIQEDKCNLLVDFERLGYKERLCYVANPSRALAHCLFSIAEVLHSVHCEYEKDYYLKAYKLGLNMVIDHQVDDIEKAAVLLDLGMWFKWPQYLVTAARLLRKRVINISAEVLDSEILVGLGECRTATHTSESFIGRGLDLLEGKSLNNLMDTLSFHDLPGHYELEQEGNLTKQQLDNWYSQTTKALKKSFQQEYHQDLAKVQKIYADLLTETLNEPKSAISFYERAKETYDKVGNKLGVAAVIQSEAKLYMKVKDNEKAEELYSETEGILKSMYTHKGKVTSSRLVVQVLEQRIKNLQVLERDADEKTNEVLELKREIEQTNVDLKTKITIDNETTDEDGNNEDETTKLIPPNKNTGPCNWQDVDLSRTKIGSGSEGSVLKGYWLGCEVAVKVPKEPATGDIAEWESEEYEILKNIEHPHIVQFLGVAYLRDTWCLVLELCDVDLGTFSNHHTRRNTQQPSMKVITSALQGATKGLIYLHSKKLCHMDIKPHNILIKGDTGKLADFGLTGVFGELKESSTTTTMYTWPGTPMYRAPELYRSRKPTPKADVWALALTSMEVITGSPPFLVFKSGNGTMCPQKIIDNELPHTIQLLSQDLQPHFLRALCFDPQQRCTAKEWLEILNSVVPQCK